MNGQDSLARTSWLCSAELRRPVDPRVTPRARQVLLPLSLLLSALLALVWLFPTTTGAQAAPSGADVYGINFNGVHQGPNKLQALMLIHQAGVVWIRGVPCNWRDVQPRPGQWNWSACDENLNDVTSVGMQPVVLFSYSTSWCTTASPGARSLHWYPPCDYQQFSNFVFHLVARYGATPHPELEGDGGGPYGQGKVQYWEVGNEPDVPGSLALPAGSSPQDAASIYAHLLRAAHDAIKSADPNAQILIGGLAHGGGAGQTQRPDFLRAVLTDPTYPGGESFDVMNFHTYGDQATFQQELQSVHAAFAQAGVPEKPIWVTEAGHASDPNHPSFQFTDPRYANTEAGQANWIQDMLPYIVSQGVQRVFYYTIADDPLDTSTKYCTDGLLYIPGYQCNQAGPAPQDATWTPKQGFATFASLLAGPAPTPAAPAAEAQPSQ
jgi:hypothetical protein